MGRKVILNERFGVGGGEDGRVVGWGGKEGWEAEDVIVVAVSAEDEVGLGAVRI